MIARLAIRASQTTPPPKPRNVDNKCTENPLSGFLALPREWQEAVLEACDGTGTESPDSLVLALEPAPALPEIVRIGRAILARPTSRKRKENLSSRAKVVLDAAVDAELTYQEACDAWNAARPLQRLAASVAERTKELRHIGPQTLRLLTASDEELLIEAERIADAMQARHESRILRGLSGIHPRDRDARSIRRRLRRRVGRAAAWAAGILRLIGGRARLRLPSYADDWSLRRWKQVQERGRAFLADHIARSEHGVEVSMLEIAAGSQRGRRAMWYSIILGMRERAKRDGRVPLFVSATLPPKWHPHPTKGDLQYDTALSPTVAAKELAKLWHWVLCMLRERGVRPYGVRTVEPHEDSTPHLHACLWVRPEDVQNMRECLGQHFPAATAEEEEARRTGDWMKGPALTVKTWEVRKEGNERGAADPASYVMTYVLKTLAGSSEGEEGEDDADRARAWASHVGLRRLSLIGLAQGTLGRWRAVYRLMSDHDRAGTRIECPRARSIAHALRRGHWGTALLLLGALSAEPRLASWRQETINVWGDTVRQTAGYFHPDTGEVIAEVRPVAWVIVRAGADKSLNDAPLSIVVSSPRAAPSARPGANPARPPAALPPPGGPP